MINSFLYRYPEKVNKLDYSKNKIINDTFYGLPKEVKFCKSCVISNQRPVTSVEFRNDGADKKKVISFNSEGICDACLVRREKQTINWKDRELELKEICNKYRSKDGNYDCLVPGSGGKDSFMTAHLLKYKYGMNPLTCTWAPHIYTDWGWKNHQAWIHAGFDNILFTPNGKVHRLITRLATEKLFYPFQPFILGQKNVPPKIAAKFDIKLIFYGENQAEYGNPKSDNKSSKMSSNFYASNKNDRIFLGGCSLSELQEIGLNQADWNPYLPIENEILINKEIKYYYLGYFEKWHPQGAYYYSVENGNFQCSPERTAGTYNTYNSIDDKVDDFHYHTTYIKFGIGRCTYDAAQEIRSGDLTREEGVALVKKYDGEFPERWSEEIFNYLSLPAEDFPEYHKFFEQPIFDKTYYELLCDKFRSPHLWYWDENNQKWILRNKVVNNNQLSQEESAVSWIGNEEKI